MFQDSLETMLFPAITASITAFISLLGIIPLAHKLKLMDLPNARSSHETPTPRIGGIGVITGVAVAFAIFGKLNSASLIISGIFGLLIIVSLLDDKFDLPAAIRFAVHFIVAGLLVGIFNLYPQQLSGPYFSISISAWLAIPITVLLIVAFLNFFNFMDGINGIAAFQASLGALGLAGVLAVEGISSGNIILICGAIAGACLGFLPLNFPKAKTFMGDCGSTALGLGMISLACYGFSKTQISFIAVLLPIWPFIYDATFTVIKRAIRGEKVWKAHREHHYQLLIRAGWSHSIVSLIYAAQIIACSTLAIFYNLTKSNAIRLGITFGILLGYGILSFSIHRYFKRVKSA